MAIKLYKFAVIAIVLLTLADFNLRSFKFVSSEHRNYQRWLSDLDSKLLNDPAKVKDLEISAQINSIFYKLTLNSPEDSDSFLRILELVRESEVLSLDDSAESSNIKLYISGLGQHFSTIIPEEIATNDKKIQLLFKLLQLKSEPVENSTLALRESKENKNEQN